MEVPLSQMEKQKGCFEKNDYIRELLLIMIT